VVVVVALVNLPLVHSSWLRSQVERSGVDVNAEVAGGPDRGGRAYVDFVLPDRVGDVALDAAERAGSVEVDDQVRDRAVETGELEVRVLPDRPSAYAVDGEVRGRGLLVLTLLADLLVLLAAGLLWRFRAGLRPDLVLRATADVERCPPGVRLERLVDDEYVVQGEVEEIAANRVALLVGTRRVVVELDGHANPVRHQQGALVRGRLIG
jgi:hypothetical protein